MNKILTILLICTLVSCFSKKELKREYKLVWSDEFEQDSNEIDSSKWFLETMAPNNGSWYNNEVQHYTDRLDNAIVSGGTLKIIAKKRRLYKFWNDTVLYFCSIKFQIFFNLWESGYSSEITPCKRYLAGNLDSWE